MAAQTFFNLFIFFVVIEYIISTFMQITGSIRNQYHSPGVETFHSLVKIVGVAGRMIFFILLITKSAFVLEKATLLVGP